MLILCAANIEFFFLTILVKTQFPRSCHGARVPFLTGS
jgi:hypothetical protein